MDYIYSLFNYYPIILWKHTDINLERDYDNIMIIRYFKTNETITEFKIRYNIKHKLFIDKTIPRNEGTFYKYDTTLPMPTSFLDESKTFNELNIKPNDNIIICDLDAKNNLPIYVWKNTDIKLNRDVDDFILFAARCHPYREIKYFNENESIYDFKIRNGIKQKLFINDVIPRTLIRCKMMIPNKIIFLDETKTFAELNIKSNAHIIIDDL